MATNEVRRPVMVEWYDAEAINGWTGEGELAEYLKGFKPVISVGFPWRTVEENGGYYILYSDFDEANQHLNRIQIIPDGWTVRVWQLAVGKAQKRP